MLAAAVQIFASFLSVIAFFGLLFLVERGYAALMRWLTRGAFE